MAEPKESNDLESQMDVAVNAEDIETEEDLEVLFERASMQRAARRATDPEWTTRKYCHKHTAVCGYAVGIIHADPWYHGYELPPNFEKVVNVIAAKMESEPPGANETGEVLFVSLQELRDWFYKVSMGIPEFLAWNDTDGPDITFTSRYTPTPDERDFIDLDAVIQNICVVLRNWQRDDERFEKKFKEEQEDAKSE